MKYNALALVVFLFAISAHAQTNLSLKEAVQIALSKSDEVNLAHTKAATKNYEAQSVKMNQYPDLKLSGQYMRLTAANMTMKNAQNNESGSTAQNEETEAPKYVALGQASVSMPIFSGFKLHNSVKASEQLYESELAYASQTQQETAMKVVQFYADLYKAQKSVELFRESLKSSHQRVVDFSAMEQNGLLARNDLLKAQLQESSIQLSLDEAEKNVRLINYSLVTLLKMAPETKVVVREDNIDPNLFAFGVGTEADALGQRKDLAALGHLKQASDANIKVAKAAYFPSLTLSGGYIALDLDNVVRVDNAMNVGVGLSYNLSSLFKNGKEVKAAKSRALEIQTQQSILTDAIKTQVNAAREGYELSLKQNNVYTQAVAQADENYRIVKDKYDNGLSDTNDLLEADVQDLEAKINQAYARANVALKFYELLDATGQLTQSFNLTQN
ncbi:TolC family protein [Flavobacterium caeni]|uniref:Outer membrane protein TolC n=1 Tax=Flavobacterium caeni TaxID=490189 RepID=A0A1G5B6I9_9FLAO|nr:TolC family protein [Flavobacterium caeni]SCX85737.1 Outer membrane protein TolC [Flavobacterium caeni]